MASSIPALRITDSRTMINTRIAVKVKVVGFTSVAPI